MKTEFSVGKVKDWHNPRNEMCLHNDSAELDCTCKRPVKRKPYRCVRVRDEGVSHRVNPRLIFEIYPDGNLAMREARRKIRFYWNAADLYRHLMWRAALAHQNAKRKARAERRKIRRGK